MSWNNKVVWSEGLFLRPQHLQQQDRYVEHLIEQRAAPLRPDAWGFTELKLDTEKLAIGRFSIASAAGVLPDGTPFRIPDDQNPPAPLSIPNDVRNTQICLCLPLRRPGTQEVDAHEEGEGLARLTSVEHNVRDVTASAVNAAAVEIGMLRLRYLLESDERGEYASLGVARIVEVRSDGQVILDDQYIPPLLDCTASRTLHGFVTELQGLLHHRGEALAERAGQGGSSASTMVDFLMLQVVNRYQPLAAHLAGISRLHPESLYRVLVQIAGELATFTTDARRAPSFPAYQHDALTATFEPVRESLRDALKTVLDASAVSIEIKERKYGVRLGRVGDTSLFDDASFVLAVSADLPSEQIRSNLPMQLKIGSPERIKQLVNLQLPGIQIRPLPVAPPQIRFHAGHVYFELDRNNELWPELGQAGAVAMHLSGDFPGINFQLWAIRS